MIVVTGASGHVGGNLVRALLARGDKVRAVYRSDTRAIDGLDVEKVQADVTDPDSLVRAFQGADTVFHLAALISIVGEQGGLVMRTNVEGPRNVVDACLANGVRRLVHFSSIHAFEQRPHDARLDEERPNVAGSGHPAYDRSKAGGEAEIRAGIARGLDAVIVNPTAVMGPYDFKLSRMGTVVLMLARRKLPSLINGGFDWVDVRDVVAGALAAAEKGRTGEKYLLSGRWASVKDLASVVEQVTGAKPPAFTSPMWLAKVGAPFMGLWAAATRTQPLYTLEALHALESNRDIRHDKAAAELGYTARPLYETIRDAVAWFREAGMLPPA